MTGVAGAEVADGGAPRAEFALVEQAEQGDAAVEPDGDAPTAAVAKGRAEAAGTTEDAIPAEEGLLADAVDGASEEDHASEARITATAASMVRSGRIEPERLAQPRRLP